MNDDQNDNPKMQSKPPPYSSDPIPTVTIVDGVHTGEVHEMQPGVVHTVQTGTTFIHSNIGVPVVIVPSMGPLPAPTTCRSCGFEIVTRVDQKPSTKTHLWATLLCLLGGLLCVWIPYCTKSCHNADHYCPNCNAYIGSHRH